MTSALEILLSKGLYTAIKIRRMGFYGSITTFNTQSYIFLIIWNIFCLGLLLSSILLWSDVKHLLIFSIIFQAYALGALIGQITRQRNISK